MTVIFNKATIFPATEDVYPSVTYLTLHYGKKTLLLKVSPFILYPMPTPPNSPLYPLITSIFGEIEEVWLLASSKFKFTDNEYYYEHEIVMFGVFEQGTKKF